MTRFPRMCHKKISVIGAVMFINLNFSLEDLLKLFELITLIYLFTTRFVLRGSRTLLIEDVLPQIFELLS